MPLNHGKRNITPINFFTHKKYNYMPKSMSFAVFLLSWTLRDANNNFI